MDPSGLISINQIAIRVGVGFGAGAAIGGTIGAFTPIGPGVGAIGGGALGAVIFLGDLILDEFNNSGINNFSDNQCTPNIERIPANQNDMLIRANKGPFSNLTFRK